MKLKSIFLKIIVISIITSCYSQNNNLSGTWQLVGIDENGKTSEIFNYILNLYGYDAEQEATLLRARGDYIGAALADERASNLKNNYKEIMIQMIDILKPLGFNITFVEGQIKMEIMGQQIVNKYRIKNNTIILEQIGIETEHDFRFDGDKLIYDGFIWEKVTK